MLCRITDMHDKEVINVCDGTRLGCVDDVEVDTCTAQLVAIVIHGRPKCMGFMGHEEDLVIGWKEIEVIGEQTIYGMRLHPGILAERMRFSPNTGQRFSLRKAA